MTYLVSPATYSLHILDKFIFLCFVKPDLRNKFCPEPEYEVRNIESFFLYNNARAGLFPRFSVRIVNIRINEVRINEV